MKAINAKSNGGNGPLVFEAAVPVETMNHSQETNGHRDRQIVERLKNSALYQQYERAYSEATGMAMALESVDAWQLSLHGKKNENPFCKLIADQSRSCSACLQLQQELAETAVESPQTLTCPYGLCDTAVPVRLGDRLIGFLRTGQVFVKKPTATRFDRTLKFLEKRGVNFSEDHLRESWFQTKTVSPKQYQATVQLLNFFADQLSTLSNQIVLQEENAEPAMISRAKQYIREHYTDELSLGQVARAVSTSSFYFCKMFKKVTGLNFTDYVSRVRIEKAKNLLMNPNLRISEIAYEVGFQSLTHFNRVFKKLLGVSPTDYRGRLKMA